MRVLVSCANGSGTSLMMKGKVEQALQELNVHIDNIHHCAIAEGKATAHQYDVVFCSSNFVELFEDAAAQGVLILGMKNILSVDEAKLRIREAGLEGKNE